MQQKLKIAGVSVKICCQLFKFYFVSEINLKSGLKCMASEALSMGMFQSSADFNYLIFSYYPASSFLQ